MDFIELITSKWGEYTLVGGALAIIAIAVKIIYFQITKAKTDKSDIAKDKTMAAYEAQINVLKDNLQTSKDIYDKFISNYEVINEKLIENHKLTLEALADSKIALEKTANAVESMENTIEQGSKINEKLSASVDGLKDTIVGNLLKITH